MSTLGLELVIKALKGDTAASSGIASQKGWEPSSQHLFLASSDFFLALLLNSQILPINL